LFVDVAGRAFVALEVEPRRRLRARAETLREASAQALALHGVEVHGRGLFPTGPCIVIANHLSWLDPLVVASILPVSPIAKHEVRRWPFVGPLCASLGCMFVERGSASSGARVLRAARRALSEGVSVLGFPEGTTRPFGAGLGPFHRGLFGMARLLGIPIVPVALRYEDPASHWVGDDGFVGHWMRVASRAQTRVCVRVGRPIRARREEALGRLIDDTRRALTSLDGSSGQVNRWLA
jgi:1-acyl-sn-glycerol-3-phosphate acyltransferase